MSFYRHVCACMCTIWEWGNWHPWRIKGPLGSQFSPSTMAASLYASDPCPLRPESCLLTHGHRTQLSSVHTEHQVPKVPQQLGIVDPLGG